jgi:ParB family transcriptional regulator, chromosome partitioning protein
MTNPKQNKDALGKGIRSLLQSIDSDLKNTSGQLKPQAVEAATSVLRLPLENIETNPKQPRRDFDEQGLQELAQSIRSHDIIQPVTVSKLQQIPADLRRTQAEGSKVGWTEGYPRLCTPGQ